MQKKKMIVVQCWDDGVTTDARLTDLLRQLQIPATFNLCPGMYDKRARFGWIHKQTEVWRLGWDEMRSVYNGFTIANHSLTHPNLCDLPVTEARHEIAVARDRLQQFFGQPVMGFVYPFGAFNSTIMTLVKETGHCYARTTQPAEQSFPPANPMAFHPNCHFLSQDFWLQYENSRKWGLFYFWGHSYELISENLWQEFEVKLRRITEDPCSVWGELPQLFSGSDLTAT
ncbi:polysaccharide deacetylase family protein [Desulfogranum japonicum]|uniref:polysaccharide deacetylase family protein n=1 Tax=Desulfogranum japonicum TaxID=231447 RepID=UPI000A04D5C6|nr:polysaccharide deacetylase family protein [Desulfogranum japonicum]